MLHISYFRTHHTHFALHHAYITSLRNSMDIITCHFYCLSAIILLCHTCGLVPGHLLISWSHWITHRSCSSPPPNLLLWSPMFYFCHSSLSPHHYYCSLFQKVQSVGRQVCQTSGANRKPALLNVWTTYCKPVVWVIILIISSTWSVRPNWWLPLQLVATSSFGKGLYVHGSMGSPSAVAPCGIIRWAGAI